MAKRIKKEYVIDFSDVTFEKVVDDFDSMKFKYVETQGFSNFVENYRRLVGHLKSKTVLKEFLRQNYPGHSVREFFSELSFSESTYQKINSYVLKTLPPKIEALFGTKYTELYYSIREAFYEKLVYFHPYRYVLLKTGLSITAFNNQFGSHNYYASSVYRLALSKSKLKQVEKFLILVLNMLTK